MYPSKSIPVSTMMRREIELAVTSLFVLWRTFPSRAQAAARLSSLSRTNIRHLPRSATTAGLRENQEIRHGGLHGESRSRLVLGGEDFYGRYGFATAIKILR
ncbi:hypothetical protein TIFTF001_056601 [Ficus carica]|uniref:Uncharacterized protein n=1 Tax=Ficus carica TaxID=3494 RepID=A0AA88EIH3_FICCA|nr:hypothetical protein TIFTF001_056601 [Ficus carica]